MDAGVFQSMASLHKTYSTHIMGWPRSCGFHMRKTKQEMMSLRKGSQTVVPVFAYPHTDERAAMHICTLGNSSSSDIKGEVGDTRWLARGRCGLADEP